MNYWRCKCGDIESFESGMPPKACHVCAKCGSTLAQSPSTHRDPEPHEPELRYDERTGKPSHRVCVKCQERLPMEVAP